MKDNVKTNTVKEPLYVPGLYIALGALVALLKVQGEACTTICDAISECWSSLPDVDDWAVLKKFLQERQTAKKKIKTTVGASCE